MLQFVVSKRSRVSQRKIEVLTHPGKRILKIRICFQILKMGAKLSAVKSPEELEHQQEQELQPFVDKSKFPYVIGVSFYYLLSKIYCKYIIIISEQRVVHLTVASLQRTL